MAKSWNIAYGARQLYQYKFTLKLEQLMNTEETGKDLKKYLTVTVDKAPGNVVDYYATTIKDLTPIDNPIAEIFNKLREDNSIMTATLNFQRFAKNLYKKAYDAKKEYGAMVELAREGKGDWPVTTAPEYEIVRQLNAEYDEQITGKLKEILGRYFIQAVILSLGNGRLENTKEGEESDCTCFYLFDGKTLKEVVDIFGKLKYLA